MSQSQRSICCVCGVDSVLQRGGEGQTGSEVLERPRSHLWTDRCVHPPCDPLTNQPLAVDGVEACWGDRKWQTFAAQGWNFPVKRTSGRRTYEKSWLLLWVSVRLCTNQGTVERSAGQVTDTLKHLVKYKQLLSSRANNLLLTFITNRL